MSTCRICHHSNEPLLKYGVRHYCHASCGFVKFGKLFVDMLPTHQISGKMPFRDAERAGWTFDALSAYIKKREDNNQVGPINV